MSPRVKGAQNITPKHTQNKTKNKQTKLITGYTLCDVNNEDTIRHNIAFMTYTGSVYIPYPLGTIIK